MPVIDEDADVGYWRARAGRAEARVAELEAATAALRADKARLNARVAELAGQVLVDAADGADLLVVGSSGHGGLAQALLGSVSQYCGHNASCPVVIMRGKYEG